MKGFPLRKWWTLQLAALHSELNLIAVAVLMRLIAHHNNNTERCDPSEERLAAYLNRDTRTVRTALRKLEKAGFISTYRFGTVPSRNHYTIHFFEGGAEAFKRAEEIALLKRKKTSAKQEKEQHKCSSEGKSRKRGRETASNRNGRSAGDQNAKRKKLENRLVECLGGETLGWERLIGIDGRLLDHVAGRFSSGEVSLDEAVLMVLDASK